ncbi:MAG TPA: hypothetical protein VMT43_00805, partial [Acidimicrobiales bacterium]|nr:hypothetical protein [Acidimicrobiales bacterium]
MPALTSTFDPAVAGALPGPEWLRARRQAAAERLVGIELPTSEEEVWRYSPIDDLDLDSFSLLTADRPRPVASEPALEATRSAGEAAGSLVVVDG